MTRPRLSLELQQLPPRRRAVMTCKFCGCDDRHPCLIGYVWAPGDVLITGDELGGEFVLLAQPGQIADLTDPCHWIAPRICSAPKCVERAYLETRWEAIA